MKVLLGNESFMRLVSLNLCKLGLKLPKIIKGSWKFGVSEVFATDTF